MILNHSSSGLNPNPLLLYITAIAYFNEQILHAMDTGWGTRVAFLDLNMTNVKLSSLMKTSKNLTRTRLLIYFYNKILELSK